MNRPTFSIRSLADLSRLGRWARRLAFDGCERHGDFIALTSGGRNVGAVYVADPTWRRDAEIICAAVTIRREDAWEPPPEYASQFRLAA